MAYFIGFMAAITLIVFVVTMFFAVLGGKDSDLWKPFAYAAFWWVILPIKAAKRLRRIQ